MSRSDLLRPTFRLKLLIALLGTIVPLLVVTLFVVRHEANRQVEAIVESTTRRAEEAFVQIERIRQQELEQMAARFTNSNRWGAALQQALEGDVPFFVEITRYELDYGGVPNALAVVTDLSAQPIAAVFNGEPLADPASALSSAVVDRLFAGDSAIFGYHLIGSQLLSVHPTVVYLGEPVGLLMLGLAVDDATARSLAEALGADVCFMANGKCVASSDRIVQADRIENVARPLPGAVTPGLQIALRIPLDDAIRPFVTIQRSIRLVGLIVLLLAIVIALLLSRGLARPVRALVAATERVARGDYDTHVRVKSRDELGVLAAAFNDMTHGLMLKEKYKGVLDKVVSRDVADEMLKGEITLGGELREVTTLFADLRGFTPLSESLPPEEVVSLLNDIMEHAEAAIVAEGGVVDKYVGDEIMALFGAPVSRGDDALRAVRAALRMQDEVARINARRALEDKQPVVLGIGINTGAVIAGNMGSARRLNYTVLGSPVNLAARLCSMASGGQIVISRDTLEQVTGQVTVRDLGVREVKGIARSVEVFEVLGVTAEPRVASAARSTAVLIAALMLAAAPQLHAQRSISAGPFQLIPSGRIDLAAYVPDEAPAGLIRATDPFVAPRISALLDVFAGARLYAFTELRVDRGEAAGNGDLQARVQQAFVRFTPFDFDASLQAGKFVSPFGAYPQVHHSISDPLIRPPLAYDYRTLVSTLFVPRFNDGFLGWKHDPATFRARGAPPVWDAPYQVGVALLGSMRALSYRLALMNSAPSTEPAVWTRLPSSVDELSLVANVGAQITPELRLGASYSHGAYIDADSTGALPQGTTIADFPQTLLGLDVTITRGFVQLRGELIHDTWQVPNVREHAIDLSYYAEVKVKLAAGAFVAARYNAIRFNDIASDSGPAETWDYDVRRLQLGAGYRFTESLEARGEYMVNSSDDPSGGRDNLFAVQASWTVH